MTNNEHQKQSAGHFAGMRGFMAVWLGQLVSLTGTGMTRFAIIFWAFQETGEATTLALLTVFSFTPKVLLSPTAGALVDRWNRKTVMILSDLGAGAATCTLLVLALSGHLEIWHLYVAGFVAGSFETFQVPAYGAAITMMLPKAQYARASGMMSTIQSASEIGAPIFAGAFLGLIGIVGIFIIDVITFAFAVSALLLVHVPQPKKSAEGKQARGNLLQESLFGFRYILKYPGLLGLQLLFFTGNLMTSFAFVLLPAMVLARTGNDELALGSVQSVMAFGSLAGGILLSIWGGPAKRIHGVLIGWGLSMLAQIFFGLSSGVFAWAALAFCMMFFTPILNGSNQAIWQSKVPPDIQGRVFGARRLIAQVSWPLAALLGGLTADHLLEPAMQAGGSLAGVFGPFVGTGSGAGIALMFVLSGIVGCLAAFSAYGFREIREVEQRIPDHDAAGEGS